MAEIDRERAKLLTALMTPYPEDAQKKGLHGYEIRIAKPNMLLQQFAFGFRCVMPVEIICDGVVLDTVCIAPYIGVDRACLEGWILDLLQKAARGVSCEDRAVLMTNMRDAIRRAWCDSVDTQEMQVVPREAGQN